MTGAFGPLDEAELSHLYGYADAYGAVSCVYLPYCHVETIVIERDDRDSQPGTVAKLRHVRAVIEKAMPQTSALS